MKIGDIVIFKTFPKVTGLAPITYGNEEYLHIITKLTPTCTALVTGYKDAIDELHPEHLYIINNYHDNRFEYKKPTLQDIAKVLSTNQIVRPKYKEKLAEYVISLMEKENV